MIGYAVVKEAWLGEPCENVVIGYFKTRKEAAKWILFCGNIYSGYRVDAVLMQPDWTFSEVELCF